MSKKKNKKTNPTVKAEQNTETIDAIAAKQPNTVPVQYPNLVAANATPYIGGYGYNYGNGFGGGIVL